jgi:hypothetical protein
VAQIVENDCEPRFSDFARSGSPSSGRQRSDYVNRVRPIPVASKIEVKYSLARRFREGKFVLARDFSERLFQRVGLRGIAKGYIDVVDRDAALGASRLRANADFRGAVRDALRGGDNLVGNGATLRLGERFPAASGKGNKSEGNQTEEKKSRVAGNTRRN